MKSSKKCPVCHGRLVQKEVEKFLRGNGDTAILRVKADICEHCGIRLYPPETMVRIAEVKDKLKRGKLKDFILIGKSYKVA